jgi:hypothetical protein
MTAAGSEMDLDDYAEDVNSIVTVYEDMVMAG